MTKNKKLKTLHIYPNAYNETFYVYVGNSVTVGTKVKVSSHLGWEPLVWWSENTDVITNVKRGAIFTGVSAGTAQFSGESPMSDILRYRANGTIHVVEITSDKYKIINDAEYIVLGGTKCSYNEFISHIIPSNEEVTYKIFNGKDEVTGGNIVESMTLEVYYKDEVLKKFKLVNDYLEFDDDISVDEDNQYLFGISFDTTVNEMLEKIFTSGSITIYDKNMVEITDTNLVGTGSKLVVKTSEKTYEYLFLLSGDVDGDGKLRLSDIMKIANYVYKNKNSLSDVYLLAADYDKNGSYNLQDIMKVANKVYKGGN